MSEDRMDERWAATLTGGLRLSARGDSDYHRQAGILTLGCNVGSSIISWRLSSST